MARTFTTTFAFNGKKYTAVVTQLDGIMKIYIPDESLHKIIPDGKASIKSKEEILIGHSPTTPAQHLLLGVLSALYNENEI